LAVLTGIITGSAGVSTNQKRDIDVVLHKLQPYLYPLQQWLMLINKKSKKVTNPDGKFEWYERSFVPHQTTVSAAITESSGLTLNASNVADVTMFNIGDIVLIEATGEMASVVSSGTTIGTTIVLNHIDGSTSLSSLTASHVGSYIKVIGSDQYEYTATSGRVSLVQKEVNHYNYLNEFVDYITTSGRQEAGETYTDGTTHAEYVSEQILQMRAKIERYLLYAPLRGYKTSGNERQTYGYGLEPIITTNVESYTGTLSEDAFDDYLKSVFAKGTKKKIHFAGSDQVRDINKFMKTRYELNQNSGTTADFKKYGISIPDYITPYGEVALMWNPMLDGKYVNYGFTLDEKYVSLRYMAPDKQGPRKFRIRKVDLGRNRGTETEILFDIGLQVMHEETHGKLYKAA